MEVGKAQGPVCGLATVDALDIFDDLEVVLELSWFLDEQRHTFLASILAAATKPSRQVDESFVPRGKVSYKQ